jgi:hypothetical protein
MSYLRLIEVKDPKLVKNTILERIERSISTKISLTPRKFPKSPVIERIVIVPKIKEERR